VTFEPSGIVTLLTDFGTKDDYVASMKGVILTQFPEARLVDLTHDVEPQDVMEAALILGNCYIHFPPGTVHCTVVDPGVGGDRKPIVVITEKHAFVGPDNGVFSRIYALEEFVEVREITSREFQRNEISPTFHGRDIFAPTAARIARGESPADAGPILDSYIELRPPEPDVWKDVIKGEVIHLDGFGNIITNIRRSLFERLVADRRFEIEINGRKIDRLTKTYDQAEVGKFLALFGSTEMLEISVRGGSAEKRVGAGKGDTVTVTILGEGRRPENVPMF
jgi:S-adenosylmethionine hydrolase